MKDLLRRIQALWEGLAPRERILVGLAGGALAFVILAFGIVMPVMGATDHARTVAEDAEQQLRLMERMRRDWDGLHDRLDSVESKIQSTRDEQNLLTLLATLASRAGVQPSSMEKRQSGESEQYEETKVEVSLKGVSLQQAVSYLSSIERESRPLSVKSLRIKRRPGRTGADGEAEADPIDVTFSVSAFKPR